MLKKGNFDAHTEIPILKRVSLILIRLKLMFSQKAGVAQWEHAGLATQWKAARVELGAKFVCWWRCEIGLCEIG